MYKINYNTLLTTDVKQFFQIPKNKKESDRINNLIIQKSEEKDKQN